MEALREDEEEKERRGKEEGKRKVGYRKKRGRRRFEVKIGGGEINSQVHGIQTMQDLLNGKSIL